ncbi:hypothetical protein AAY473_000608 [Plecturocebus cupreus]
MLRMATSSLRRDHGEKARPSVVDTHPKVSIVSVTQHGKPRSDSYYCHTSPARGSCRKESGLLPNKNRRVSSLEIRTQQSFLNNTQSLKSGSVAQAGVQWHDDLSSLKPGLPRLQRSSHLSLPSWSAVVRSRLTAISVSWVQVIPLPQLPEELGLQSCTNTPS